MRVCWPSGVSILAALVLHFAACGAAFAQAGASSASAQPDAAAANKSSGSDPSFDILEFRIEGNSVLPTIDVERAVMPFLGPKRHFADVESARKALEDLYQKRGYQTVFVEIPEQKISRGAIRLHVLEGQVERTRVVGSRYFLLSEIRSKASDLAPGSVPDFNAVQQELAQLNKLPDRQVSPILKPGRTPGGVEVELSVRDELPLHGDIEIDNHASPFTSSERANASLRYDNLWQREHSIAINYQVAPQKRSEANVVYGTYLWRFAESDDVISLYAIRSNSDIAVVGSASILGNARIYGARWIHPLGSGTSGGSSYFHSVTLGIDRKDFGQTNASAQTGNATVYPPISYSPLSLSYGANLVREQGSVQFSIGPSTAPRGVFGNSDAEFIGRRVLSGGAGYVALKMDSSVEQWVSRRWSGYGRLQGQYTSDALIPNEQFIMGGFDTVRGYRESEVTGDRGAQATLEARFYPIGRPQLDGKRQLYALAFGDAASVRFVAPQGAQVHGNVLGSVGLGLRAQGWHGLHAAADVADALHDGGSGVGGPITRKGAKRVDASLGWSF